MAGERDFAERVDDALERVHAGERSPTMERVDTEVALIYGEIISYTPQQVSGWLRHWHEVFNDRACEESWRWATARADIFNAVRDRCTPHTQLFFRLYCLEGLDYTEIEECCRWSSKTCSNRWSELSRAVIEALCDCEVCQRPTPDRCRGAMPTTYAAGTEGKFDCWHKIV